MTMELFIATAALNSLNVRHKIAHIGTSIFSKITCSNIVVYTSIACLIMFLLVYLDAVFVDTKIFIVITT